MAWRRRWFSREFKVKVALKVLKEQLTIAQLLNCSIAQNRMPEYIWEGTDERIQRLLGQHGKGAYG